MQDSAKPGPVFSHDLTAVEARNLAQDALEDEERVGAVRVGAVRRFRTFTWWGVAAAVAAAVVFLLATWRRTPALLAEATARTPERIQRVRPTLLAEAWETKAGPPADAGRFRAPIQESRPPRQNGSILTIEDGMATVDLGSLDGLEKGRRASVVRDGSPASIARLRVATVFRDRARATIATGQAAPGRRPEDMQSRLRPDELLLEFVKNPATRDFLYWAPVILAGDPGPLPANLFTRQVF